MRDRRFKLHFPHGYRTLAGRAGGIGGRPVPYAQAKTGRELFDLKNDVGETEDVADEHPDVVARLLRFAELAREELGDKLTDRPGTARRPPGRLGPDDQRLIW